jgi:hypothetical protein
MATRSRGRRAKSGFSSRSVRLPKRSYSGQVCRSDSASCSERVDGGLSNFSAVHMPLEKLRFPSRSTVALGAIVTSSVFAFFLALGSARVTEASPAPSRRHMTLPFRNAADLVEDGLLNFVRAAMSQVPADNPEGTELGAPYCLRRPEAPTVPAGSASTDASLSLPKWQTGREAGTQSNGSLRDGRATEEALSADEPSLSTSFGGEAVCKGS